MVIGKLSGIDDQKVLKINCLKVNISHMTIKSHYSYIIQSYQVSQ